MSYHVLNIPKSKIQGMKKHYESFLKEKTPQSAAFAAKTNLCSITAYQSGKVLFQGKGATEEARIWEKANGVSVSKKNKSSSSSSVSSVDKHEYYPPNDISTSVLLGSDETGTGDYFGPITVVCVHLSLEQMNTIDSWGVRDSKTIKDLTIRQLAPRLLKESTYSLLILANEKYNHLQEKGLNQGQMKALLHHQAIMNVMEKCEQKQLSYEGVLIDQFVTPKKYFEYLSIKQKSWTSKKPLYFATKAESLHPAVAAASILARYSFLQEMDKLEKSLGMTIPKGAGPAVDSAAKKFIQEQGQEALYQITKWHFANTKKILG